MFMPKEDGISEIPTYKSVPGSESSQMAAGALLVSDATGYERHKCRTLARGTSWLGFDVSRKPTFDLCR